MHTELDSLHWFSQCRSRTPHFWGCAPLWGYGPQIWTQQRFVYSAPTPKSLIIVCLLVQNLSCWQTHKQTNRCRWKHPMFFATVRRWVKICIQSLKCNDCVKQAGVWYCAGISPAVWWFRSHCIDLTVCCICKIETCYTLWDDCKWRW